ncbi:MAG: RHS repeat protein, partial [Waddliaceae bacterium]|nr:RHS repeat protein [Waddliaceae bacterium]
YEENIVVKKGNAEAPDLPSSSVNDYIPDGIFNGTVNVITGDYIENSIDFVVPGIAPVIMKRSYRHSLSPSRFDVLKRYTIASGWNHPFYQNIWFMKGGGKKHHYADIRSSSGAILHYDGKGKVKHDNLHMTLRADAYETSLTNSSSGMISGRTNLKNSYIEPDRNTKQYAKECLFTKGDGSKSLFKMYDHLSGLTKYDFAGKYYLAHEKLPNGNTVYYDYLNNQTVSKVTTKSPTGKVIVWLSMTYDGPSNSSLYVESCDGKHAEYKTINLIDSDYCLDKVIFNNGDSHSFKYVDMSHYNEGRYMAISRHEKFDGRYIDIEYYMPGNNDVGNHPNERLDTEPRFVDLRHRRTRLIKESVSVGSDPITTGTFIYGRDDTNKTFAYDTYDNLTVYHHRKDRIKYIDEYTGTGEPDKREAYRSKNFFWGRHGSQDATNLIATTMSDKDGKDGNNTGVVWSRTFQYDKEGNVLEERVYGNATGGKSKTFTVDKSTGVPVKDIEYSATRYTYYKDDFNLVESAITENGTKTEYRYKTGTNLLTAELVSTKDNSIQLRTFYDYDDDGCMIEKIVDDGNSIEYDAKDPAGATQRIITKIFPYQGVPGFGLPAIIKEWYYDFTTESEVLISKIVNNYDKHGMLSTSDVYDANGDFVFTTTQTYDVDGKPRTETDALGRMKTTEYDRTGNIIDVQDFRPNTHTINTYDLANRCVHSEGLYDDMPALSVNNRYDDLGNLIAVIDRYGNETLYEYDEFSRVVAVTGPKVFDEKSTVIQPTTRQQYDILDNVISIIDELDNETRMEYNVHNKPTLITYPDGTTELFRYNLDGTLRSKREANGSTIEYSYDFLGRVTREERRDNHDTFLYDTEKEYNAFNMISSIDAEGYRTNYEYDGAGRLIATTQGDTNIRIEYAYDALGRLETTREWYGAGDNDYTASVEIHDFAGRVIEKSTEDGYGIVLETVLLHYDENDNLVETTTFSSDGTKATTSTEYNDYNESIKHTDALGNTTMMAYDHKKCINSLGQRVLQTTTTDPKGTQTITIYD